MANPFDTLFSQRTDVIEAIEAGAGKIDTLSQPFVGPTTFDAIEYPSVQILPESTDYQGGNDWNHQVRLNCYFQREREATGRTNQRYLDALGAVADATVEALACLSDVSCVYNYLPTLIEDFAGEDPTGTNVYLISVRFEVKTLADLADE
jgi:hypothetical protein